MLKQPGQQDTGIHDYRLIVGTCFEVRTKNFLDIVIDVEADRYRKFEASAARTCKAGIEICAEAPII